MVGNIEELMSRLRRLGPLVLIGLFVIIWIGLGVLWVGQDAKQRELGQQIAQVSMTTAKAMPSADKLKV